MRNIIETITEARTKDTPKCTLFFDNAAAAMLFYCELKGQISDGKYENTKPFSHWYWVTNLEYKINGEEWYAGSKRRNKYNLDEWPGYIKKADSNEEDNKRWGWARRVLDYGRMGMMLGDSKTESLMNASSDKEIYAIENVAEIWGNAIRNNPDVTFDDIEVKDYQKSYVDNCGIWNKSSFNKFKKTEYTMRDLKADLVSMNTTVNTCETDKY